MCLQNNEKSIKRENLFYKQMFSKYTDCFTVVEVLMWINNKVLIEDVKSGLRYVLTDDEFLQFHETLSYGHDTPDRSDYNLLRRG